MPAHRSTAGAALIAGVLMLAGCNSEAEDPVADAPTPTYLVTTSGAHVAMSPITGTFPVKRGASIRIAVTADAGFTLASAVGGNCPEGTWSAGSYTSGSITASCALDFSAGITVFTVTPSADAAVTVSPFSAQTVALGTAQTFDLTSAPGYVVSIGGTCAAGILGSDSYVTGAVTADCTVQFVATLSTFSVTAVADAHVSLSPNTVQTVNYGSTQAFTATPSSGYALSPTVTGTCAAGAFAAGIYTTGAVTASCSVVFSTVPSWSGVRQQGRPGQTTESIGVAADSAGNAFIAGYTDGELNGTPSIGYYDGYVVKYDPLGVLLWTRRLGLVSNTTAIFALAVDSAGSVFVGGFADAGLNGNPSGNRREYFVAKYAADGTLLWVSQGGGVDATVAETHAISVDSAGNAYVVGSTNASINGNPQSGTSDGFVAKYDPQGTRLWVKQFGGAGFPTSAERVAVDATGNAFIAGYTSGALPGNTLSGNYDYVLAKYDTDGNLQWLKQSGAAGATATATGVAATPSGDVVLVGNTTGSLHGQPRIGLEDYFVARFDAAGTLTWIEQRGVASNSVNAMGVAVDTVGNALVTGYTYEGLGDAQSGIVDAFSAKFAVDGSLAWIRQIGDPGTVTISNGIAVDPSGSVFVGGRTSGGLAGNAAIGESYWLAKYSEAGVLQ